MRRFRFYYVALVSLVGMLGGCTHTQAIGVNKSGETLYLQTTCVPAFTAVSGFGGLLILSDAPDYFLAGIAGGALVDFLRCGISPPKVSTATPTILTSESKKRRIVQPSSRDVADCLDQECAHLNSMFTQGRYRECIQANKQRCQ